MDRAFESLAVHDSDHQSNLRQARVLCDCIGQQLKTRKSLAIFIEEGNNADFRISMPKLWVEIREDFIFAEC